MGLRATFHMEDLGFDLYTSELSIPIDYGEGCDVFAETFLDVSTKLVPVDTGYLLSTLAAYSTDDGCICETECEYAQYVEYGTCYMSAQPYFEPAIEAALDAAVPIWQEAVEEALEEEQLLLQEMEEEQLAAENADTAAGGFGGIFGVFIAAIVIGLARGFEEVIDEKRQSSNISFNQKSSFGRNFNIDVEIT